MEFVLPETKVVRLHGTEWSETQQFHRYSTRTGVAGARDEMSPAALQEQWARVLVSERAKTNGLPVNAFGLNTKFARRLPLLAAAGLTSEELLIVARYGVSVRPGYRIVREVGSSITVAYAMPCCWKRMPTFLRR